MLNTKYYHTSHSDDLIAEVSAAIKIFFQWLLVQQKDYV